MTTSLRRPIAAPDSARPLTPPVSYEQILRPSIRFMTLVMGGAALPGTLVATFRALTTPEALEDLNLLGTLMAIARGSARATTPPAPHAIAVCGAGMLGLITSEAPTPVTYGNGASAMAWTGLHVAGGRRSPFPGETTPLDHDGLVRVAPGAPWSARHPTILSVLDAGTSRALRDAIAACEVNGRVDGSVGGRVGSIAHRGDHAPA